MSVKTRSLQECCSLVADCPHSTPRWTENGAVVVRSNNIKNGRLDLSCPSFTDEAHFAERTKRATPKGGDLIITREAPMGEVCRIPDGVRCCLGQRQVLLRPKIDSNYLLYAIQSPYIQKQIGGHDATGSTVSNLCIPDLKAVRIPVIERESEIAEVLSTLDAKIDLNNRINEELEGLAKLLYDYWFVQFDFPISAEQAAAMGDPALEGKPYRQTGGKMVYNKTLKREIPKGWTGDSLEQLGNVVGGSTPSTERSEYFTSEGVPWITPKDLSGNRGNRFIDHGATDVTESGIKAASLKVLPAGTVLLSSRAPIGYLAIARKPVTTNQGFKSFIPAEGFSTDYVYFTLQHFMMLIKANASGSTFKEISGGTLKVVKIHFPPAQLVSEFTKTAEKLSKQQSVLEQQNQHLTELRDWLLPMLMNGQVTVRDPEADSPPTQQG